MPKPPLLTIVSVTYNNAAGLRRTLTSVYDQRGVNADLVEVVVVDGASSDDTMTVLQGFQHANLHVLSEPDNGVYDAMNKGWRRATGAFVQFLNAGDTLAGPDALVAMCDAIVRHEDAIWFVGRALHLHAGKQEPALIRNVPHIWFRHMLGMQPHCHQATLLRNELLAVTGGYSEEYNFIGDFDLFVRVGLLADPVVVDAVIVTYEGGGISAHRAAEIPTLQHQVRVDRLQLSPPLARLDWAFVRYRQTRLRVRHLRLGLRSRG